MRKRGTNIGKEKRNGKEIEVGGKKEKNWRERGRDTEWKEGN